MTRFTADEALEFQGTADAIMLTWRECTKVLNAHHADINEFHAEVWGEDNTLNDHTVDAGAVFAWLGY